jgi:PAS domain S-box-containing protein
MRAMRPGDPSAEERYRSLVENLPASVVILFDRDLRFVLVDGPEVTATGFSKEAMEGKLLREAIPEAFASAVEPNMLRVLAGERFSADIPYEDRHYHYEYVPIRGEGGAVRFGLIVGQNVTERVRAERERRELEAQLQQAGKLDALGRLAGGVAHDFNNLLTTIHGYAALLLEEAPPGTAMRADLVEIQRAAERGTTLTSQLLAFSRKHVTEAVFLDLNAVVSGSLRMLGRLLGEDVEVRFEPGSTRGTVLMDRGQLEQVLVNLAVNSRDAMPSGGSLVIATREVFLDEAFCTRRVDARPGPYVVLRVTDTGRGMSAELLEHVFEPFFTTKRVGEGTGLGLSIVYGIVRRAAGFIEVESRVGSGSTFEVFLPAHDDAAHAAPTSHPEPPTTAALAILLVEDEPAVLEVTARILRLRGYTLHTAAHPEQALALAADRNLHLDLLLTDVIMPALNGGQLFEKLRETRPDLAVVFLSGYTDDLIADRITGSVVHFVQKPFTPAALLAKIEEAVGATRRPTG